MITIKIIGPCGSGKTTTAMLIANFLDKLGATKVENHDGHVSPETLSHILKTSSLQGLSFKLMTEEE